MKTTRLLTIAASLIAGAMAMADVSVTTKAGGGYDLFRASTKLSHWANKPECEAARDRDAEARKIATANYSCREVWDTYAVKYVPPAAPIDCAVSDWGTWQAPSMTSMCTGTTGMLMGSEVRKRTITRQPANGGAACPALTETREVHQACASQSARGTRRKPDEPRASQRYIRLARAARRSSPFRRVAQRSTPRCGCRTPRKSWAAIPRATAHSASPAATRTWPMTTRSSSPASPGSRTCT